MIAKAIGTKTPPRMGLDFLWLVNESGVFEVGFNDLHHI